MNEWEEMIDSTRSTPAGRWKLVTGFALLTFEEKQFRKTVSLLSNRLLWMALTAACHLNRMAQEYLNGDKALFSAALASGQVDDQRRTAHAGNSTRQP
jgi:hypothetical protein